MFSLAWENTSIDVSMFTDEALDSVSIQSQWRKSQQSAQESVCLNNTFVKLISQTAVSINHSVVRVEYITETALYLLLRYSC